MNELDSIIESVSGPIAAQSTRDSIMALEVRLSQHPQIEIPVVHRYSGGIYSREITIPADVILTGKIYKDDHFDVMVYGDVTVTTDEGRKRLTGFNISKGNQGKKRAGYTHAETRWITFCSSPEMADDEYIDYLTVDNFSQLTGNWIEECDIRKEFESQPSYRSSEYNSFRDGYLAGTDKRLKADIDREDYNKTIAAFGFTEEVVRRQSEVMSNQIDIEGDYGVSVKSSYIEGKGLFADRCFSAGDVIMPAKIDGMRTIAGRYTNHAINPNANIVMDGENMNLVAVVDIGIEEITTDYGATLLLQNIERVA